MKLNIHWDTWALNLTYSLHRDTKDHWSLNLFVLLAGTPSPCRRVHPGITKTNSVFETHATSEGRLTASLLTQVKVSFDSSYTNTSLPKPRSLSHIVSVLVLLCVSISCNYYLGHTLTHKCTQKHGFTLSLTNSPSLTNSQSYILTRLLTQRQPFPEIVLHRWWKCVW